MIIFTRTRFNEWLDFYKYNLVPQLESGQEISKEQFRECLYCSYRTVSLEWELAQKYAKLSRGRAEDFFITDFKYSSPNCNNGNCLMNGLEVKRLLNPDGLKELNSKERIDQDVK